MKYKFGFIGCGNMGGIILDTVLKKAGTKDICACDNSKDKKERLEKLGVYVTCDTETASSCKYLFIGVKPQAFPKLFAAVKDFINEDTVIISMAAGKDIKTIEELCQKPVKVIRIMPNTAATVEEGVILYTANKLVLENELAEVTDALSFAGLVDFIEEEKIDAAAALSGCGPAFVDLFVEALADGGVACGLTREKALLYAAKTVSGAAKTIYVTGKSPAELKDMVCSPGGTTIQGVRTLEKGKFRSATMEAVIAAYNKTKDLK